MVENSEVSTENGKQSTRKTSKLTPEQALEIVQQSLREYQKAGGVVQVMDRFWFGGESYTAILLPGVKFDEQLLAITGK